MSESTSVGWYYRRGGPPLGQQAGPLTWAQLHTLGSSGSLGPADLVWHSTLPEWIPAAHVPGLFQAATPASSDPEPSRKRQAPRPAASRRRSWLLPVLIPLIALVVAGGGLGLYFGLARGGDDSATSSTITTSPPSADMGVAEAVDPDPSALVESKRFGRAPANQVLVLMAAGKGPADATAVADQLGGRVVGRMDYINLYQIQTSGATAQDLESAIAAAAALPGVDHAFPNGIDIYKARITGTKCSPLADPIYAEGDNSAALDMIGMQTAWDILQASGVELNPTHIGIVDTPVYTKSGQGISSDLNFPDPAGAYATGKPRVRGLEGKDTTDQAPADQPTTHGTQVAQTANEVAGVLGDKLTMTLSNGINAGAGAYPAPNPDLNDPTQYQGFFLRELVEMQKQIRDGATVINLSIGPEKPDAKYAWRAAAYKRFFQQAAKDHPDVLFVAAAGNEGGGLDGANYGPGGFQLPNVITVGALDHSGDRADAADWYPQADVQAFYQQQQADGSIPADWSYEDFVEHLRVGSNYATGNGEVTLAACGSGVPVGVGPDGKPLLSDGTSFATPQVTAAAALLHSINPKLTAEQIKNILVETAGTEVDRNGAKVEVPKEVGGKVLRVDNAVLKVINDMRGPDNELKLEDLLGLASVDLVAEGGPDEYTVTASVSRVGPAGADLTFTMTGEGATTGNTTQHLSGPGSVGWTVTPKAGSDPFIKVQRSDTKACAHLTIKGPPSSPGTSTTTGGTGGLKDFTLTPNGPAADGNGLITDIPIEVSAGKVTASGSGAREWLGQTGSSTATITGTYDPATGMLQAVYTGVHYNTRSAGDMVQDVTFTFTGTARQRIAPGPDGVVRLAFAGSLTVEIAGGPTHPPSTVVGYTLIITCVVERH